MAYSSITKPTDYFETKLYAGSSSNVTVSGLNFQPDWIWLKNRTNADNHVVCDVVRGGNSNGLGNLYTNLTDSEYLPSSTNDSIESINSDGFVVGGNGNTNGSGENFVSWSWSAAGSTPSKTYTVKVVSDSGNKYRFDDFGTSAVTLELSEGGTFRFDQSDSSNSGHPLRFSTTSDGTHGGGSEYTTGVTTNGTPGSSGAYTEITVAASAPTLYYYCSVHSGMGGQANTPTTNSFSSFDGSIQSNVSPNTTSGFSIVSYTGTGSAATIGHGLGSAPKMVICKTISTTGVWLTWHTGIPITGQIQLQATDAVYNPGTGLYWNSTLPTSSVFSVGTSGSVNGSGVSYIAYCFAEKKGYSKFGSYTGNNNADGNFVYLGFKPAWLLAKDSGSGQYWHLIDSVRESFNDDDAAHLSPNNSGSESTIKTDRGTAKIDFLSNGFKIRSDASLLNGTGSFIYMAFAENPFVANDSGTAVPVTAR